ncbi:MAG: hypothetical protein P9L99_19860 [Candidatus Lernaella stagnicola]|nr:hypothetical protein [Candidatus Lernaella stagnicola]
MASRLERVEQWLSEGCGREVAIERCVDEWGISRRQALRYLRRFGNRVASKSRGDMTVEWHIQKRASLFAIAEQAGNVRDSMAILKDLAELQGFYREPGGAAAGGYYEEALRDALARFLPTSK